MQKARRVQSAALLAMPFIGMMANSLLIPVLPKIATALDISFGQTTWLIAALSLASVVFVPLAGYLSDRWTRTLILAPGLALYGLGGLLAGIAPVLVDEAFGLMLAGRILQGIGSAGTTVLTMALASDLLAVRRRAQMLGMLEMSGTVGKAAGPLLGAALGGLIWFAPFFAFPAVALPVAGFLWWSLGRLPDFSEPRPPLGRYTRTLWRAVRPKVTSLLLTFLAAFWAVSIILLLLTLLSRELADAGVRGLARGGLITVPEVVMAVAAVGAGRFLREQLARRSRLLTMAGVSMIGASLAGAALSTSPWFLLGAVLLSGAGAGTVLACMNTLVADSVRDQERGVVTAFYGACRSLGTIVLPGFFALSRALGNETVVFWVLAGAVIGSGAVVAALLDPRRLVVQGEGS